MFCLRSIIGMHSKHVKSRVTDSSYILLETPEDATPQHQTIRSTLVLAPRLRTSAGLCLAGLFSACQHTICKVLLDKYSKHPGWLANLYRKRRRTPRPVRFQFEIS